MGYKEATDTMQQKFYDMLSTLSVYYSEDIEIKNPDKSKWESFCGKYEHPEDDDFIVDEVWMQDGELYARAIDEDGDKMSFRLYPIGENEFGRKGGLLKLTFCEGCVSYDDFTCKKLQGE